MTWVDWAGYPQPPIQFTAPCPHGVTVTWMHHRPEDAPIPGCWDHERLAA